MSEKQKQKEKKRLKIQALLAEVASEKLENCTLRRKNDAERSELDTPPKKKMNRTERAAAKREAIARRGEKRSMISIGQESGNNRGLLKGLQPEKEEQKETAEPSTSDSVSGRYDVFVDGVPYDWTIPDIRDLFQTAGNVVDVRAPTWQDSGRLRGYAHVTYDSLEGQQKAIKKFHMYYVTQKRYFKVTEAQARDTNTSIDVDKIPLECNRIFVKNLPYDATEPEIAGLFGGKKVSSVRIVTQYERSKGFAYIDFKDHSACVEACRNAQDGITLRGRTLRVDFETGDAKAGFHYRKEAYETRLGPAKNNIKKKKEKAERKAQKKVA